MGPMSSRITHYTKAYFTVSRGKKKNEFVASFDRDANAPVQPTVACDLLPQSEKTRLRRQELELTAVRVLGPWLPLSSMMIPLHRTLW